MGLITDLISSAIANSRDESQRQEAAGLISSLLNSYQSQDAQSSMRPAALTGAEPNALPGQLSAQNEYDPRQFSPRLRQDFADRMQDLQQDLSGQGIQTTIGEGYRSPIRQNELYAQGRSAGGPVVTGVQGGRSFHNYGAAADLAGPDTSSPDAQRAIIAMASQPWRGLKSGGTFANLYDPLHVQMADTSIARLQQEGPQGPIANAGQGIQAYVANAAARRGIDPGTALRVFGAESGLDPASIGDKGSSFGLTQLHYGGVAGGGNAGAGLGDEFTRQTGLDARDPSTWRQQVDFALNQVAKGGWGPWHAAAKTGIGNLEGIGGRPAGGNVQLAGPPPTPDTGAAQTTPMGQQMPRYSQELLARALQNPHSAALAQAIILQQLKMQNAEPSLTNVPVAGGGTQLMWLRPGQTAGTPVGAVAKSVPEAVSTAAARGIVADQQGLTGDARQKYILEGKLPSDKSDLPTSVQEYQYGQAHPDYASQQAAKRFGEADVLLGLDGQPADPALTGQAVLQAVPPPVGKQAQRYVEGLDMPPRITKFTPPWIRQSVLAAQQIDPSFDTANPRARTTFVQGLSKDMPNSPGGQVLSLNSLDQHLANLGYNFKVLGNWNAGPLSTIANTLGNTAISGGSSPQTAALNNIEATKVLAVGEIAKLAKAGVPDTQEMTRLINAIPTNAALPVQIAAIQNVRDLIEARRNGLETQARQQMGDIWTDTRKQASGGVMFASPQARDSQAYMNALDDWAKGGQRGPAPEISRELMVNPGKGNAASIAAPASVRGQEAPAQAQAPATATASGSAGGIPMGAAKLLQANPALRGAFDEKYGAGASDMVLGPAR